MILAVVAAGAITTAVATAAVTLTTSLPAGNHDTTGPTTAEPPPLQPPIDLLTLILSILTVILGYVYLTTYSSWATQPDISPSILSKQANVSAIREKESETASYRSTQLAPQAPLMTTSDAGIRTLRDAFRKARQGEASKGDAEVAVKYLESLESDEVLTVSKGEIKRRFEAFGRYLVRHVPCDVAVATGKDKLKAVAILLPASVEWLVTYQACIELGIVVVLVPVAIKMESACKILAHSGVQTVVTTMSLASSLSRMLKQACPLVKHLILTGDNTEAMDQSIRKAAIVTLFNDMMAEGSDDSGLSEAETVKLQPDSPAYVLYDMCRMDDLSGVVITHGNALAALSAYNAHFPFNERLLAPRDNYLCAVTLADATSLTFANLALANGCAISVLETEDGEKLIHRSFVLRPTFTYLSSVLARDICDLLDNNIVQYPPAERWMFKRGLKHRRNALAAGYIPRWTIWDIAYFRHFNNYLGGKLRVVFVSPYTFSFDSEKLLLLLGCQVLPMIGSTATTGAITCTRFYDYGHVVRDCSSFGPPLACSEIKLVNVVDIPMGAENHPLYGEIYVRGPAVAKSFWNDAGREKDSVLRPLLNDYGWHPTGLFAVLLPNRTLHFVGRTRETMLTPDGRISHLHVIEEALSRSPFIVQIAISLTATANRCNALVYPKASRLLEEARRLNRPFKLSNIGEYSWCSDLVERDIIRIAKEHKLGWLADPKRTSIKIKLWPQPLNSESGVVLPGGQINRLELERMFG
ncbi:hypothetical protein EV182_003301 [Spiromyces aspiralis]|uniref:Uncharacterized protein n=1 Tax=Spiromyces aspiralis TaxID=68401 RepID=A0ACC1HSS1_9FUNG|nr:hypothetical protein EV182_003301 [Spiromyces aspiralis]